MTSAAPHWTCPSFCLEASRSRPHADGAAGGDLEHRGPVESAAAPASDPTVAFGFALVQSDEVDDDGEQIVHDPEAMISFGGSSACFTLSEFEAMLEEGHRWLARLRYFQALAKNAPIARLGRPCG